MIKAHFLVVRSHNQWRKGHEFHAELTPRREALIRLGFLRCLGGRMEPPAPVVEEVLVKAKRGRRGVTVQTEQDGDGHVRPEPGDAAGGEDR